MIEFALPSHRLLIIEADPLHAHVLVAALRFGGYASDAVGGYAEALKLITENEYDAVIVEPGPPADNRWRLLTYLNDQEDIPTIVVSAHGSNEDQVEAYAAGADEFVTKPYMPSELLARVRIALRRRDAPASRTTRL